MLATLYLVQTLQNWKRAANPENIPIKEWSVQHQAKLKRLAELEHTAKVIRSVVVYMCNVFLHRAPHHAALPHDVLYDVYPMFLSVAQGAPATQQQMGSLRAQVESLQAQLKSAQEAVASAQAEVLHPLHLSACATTQQARTHSARFKYHVHA